jgi:hypothetical protein
VVRCCQGPAPWDLPREALSGKLNFNVILSKEMLHKIVPTTVQWFGRKYLDIYICSLAAHGAFFFILIVFYFEH